MCLEPNTSRIIVLRTCRGYGDKFYAYFHKLHGQHLGLDLDKGIISYSFHVCLLLNIFRKSCFADPLFSSDFSGDI